jgi:hypothetical protein
MKTILIGILSLLLLPGKSKQSIYQSIASEIVFFSEAPLENITAVNNDTRSLINTSSNEIALVVTIRGFKFKNKLMEEHFNENYLESDKYKTSVFKGKINEKIDYGAMRVYDVSASGIFDLHGVKKERTINGTLTVKENQLILFSEFDVALKDHNIKIPKAVIKNIAEDVKVTVSITYEPKQ